MPKVKIGGKVKHFPYTKKGRMATKMARKKNPVGKKKKAGKKKY